MASFGMSNVPSVFQRAGLRWAVSGLHGDTLDLRPNGRNTLVAPAERQAYARAAVTARLAELTPALAGTDRGMKPSSSPC
eukprot:1188684-Prorocentrum_minimum.AAC.6